MKLSNFIALVGCATAIKLSVDVDTSELSSFFTPEDTEMIMEDMMRGPSVEKRWVNN